MMRTLDRYVTLQFLPYFAVSACFFLGLFIVIDLFERLSVFVDNQAAVVDVVSYYLNSIPFIIVLFTPIALLLATLLALGQLNRTGELVAMLSTGVSYGRVILPMVIIGAIVSGLIFGLAEYVMPGASVAKEEVLENRIRNREKQTGRKRHVAYRGQHNRLFYVKSVDPRRGILRDVVVQSYGPDGSLTERIDAREALFDGRMWEFRQCHVRRWSPDGGTTEVPSAASRAKNYWRTDIPERSEDFLRVEPEPENMSRRALAGFIERLRDSGAATRRFEVEYHLKLAFPVVNLIIVFLGASVAARIRRTGKALGFGLSLFAGFVYFAILRAGQAFGNSGALSPLLAAWIGNLIFIGIAFVFHARAHR